MEVMTRSKIIGLFFIVLFLFTGIQQQIKGMNIQKENLTKFSITKYSPNNKFVAVVFNIESYTIFIYCVDAGNSRVMNYMKTLRGHEDVIYSVCWLDDTKIVSGSKDGTIRLWDVNSGKLLKTLKEQDITFSITLSPSGKYIAFGSSKCIAVRNSDTLNVYDKYTSKDNTETEHVYSVTWSPDGKRIAAGYKARNLGTYYDKKQNCKMLCDILHGIVRIFDVDDKGKLSLVKEKYVDGIVKLIDWLSDGKRIFICDNRSKTSMKTVSLMSLNGDAKFFKKIKNLSNSLSALASARSPNGKYLAVSFKSFKIAIYNAEDMNFLKILKKKNHNYMALSVAWLNNNEIISVYADGIICLWNLDNNTTSEIIPNSQEDCRANSVACSPNGNLVAVGFEDANIGIYSTKNGKLLLLKTLKEGWEDDVVFFEKGHTDVVHSVCWLDDTNIVSGSEDGTIRLWDVNSGKNLKTLKEQGTTFSIARSPNGKYVVFGPAGKDIAIRNSDTLDICSSAFDASVRDDCGSIVVLSVAWSPNGGQIAVGYDCGDHYNVSVPWGLIRIFDVNNNGQLSLFKEEYTGSIVKHVGWLSNGKRILIGTEKETSIKTVSSMFPKGER